MITPKAADFDDCHAPSISSLITSSFSTFFVIDILVIAFLPGTNSGSSTPLLILPAIMDQSMSERDTIDREGLPEYNNVESMGTLDV